MKRNLLRTFMVLLAIAAATIGPAWGQNSTSTLTFTGAYGTYGATADDNVVWTVTSDGAESLFDATKGIHYGSSSANVGYIELSTSGITGTITQVVVNASTASNVTATVGVTVGGNAFGGNPQSLSATATDYTFTGSASGAIVVRVAKPSAATKALYVKSIEVTYTPAPVLWPSDAVVYDFEAAAAAGENPANKNGSAANGQAFYGWEISGQTDRMRTDYKGYMWSDGSVLPRTCHVWRRSDRINGNVSTADGGLKCPSNKEMAIDSLTAGMMVVIIYDSTDANDNGSKQIIWAIGDGTTTVGLGHPRATATIGGVEAVTGVTPIRSGDTIIVTSVTPAANGTGYIVFKVKKDMVIKQIAVWEPHQPHTVRFASGNDGWTVQDVTASASATAPAILQNVMAGDSLVVTAPASLNRKVKSVKAVKYVAPMESVPMTMEALTAGTIKVTAPKSGMKYSLNGGEKIALTVTVFIDVNAGDKVALYGTATSYNGTRTNGGTAEVKVYGNIMSLIDEENFATATELTAINTFANLFKDNSALTDASGLVLPATTLTTGCYQGLFQNCTSLTQAPAKLPATALANSCYKNMFRNTGLVTVPSDLMTDAVVMARESCVSMFRESANLTTAPAITVTTMAAQSCNAMFYHCTSLTSVSALPAATLADSCYYNMFNGCTSLTTVPSDMLPATTVYKSCYENMFKGTGLTAAPELPATTLVNSCYKSMFYSCSSLSSMNCLATSSLNAEYCTEDWVNGAGTNATGTKVFTAYSNLVNWSTGNSGIPTGWTRHNLVEEW